MHDRPNILWICTDQQRWDTIAALGNHAIHTPALDRLCREGTAFTHAYCQSTVCTPSRASFMTGLYPGSIRSSRNGNARLSTDRPLISRRLADAGYACGLAGKLHLASAWNGEEQRGDDGFGSFWYSHAPAFGRHAGNQYLAWLRDRGIELDRLFARNADGSWGEYLREADPELHQARWCADRAIEFMASNRGRPWLMCVNTFDPHSPFDPPEPWRSRVEAARMPEPIARTRPTDAVDACDVSWRHMPPEDERRRWQAAYYADIQLIDHEVGRMLDALESGGERERTLVIFGSDHGELLGDHGAWSKGCRFYEGVVRVPLIWSWPTRVASAQVRGELVELVDIAPTIAELAALPPALSHGRSLLPLLEGREARDWRTAVRCEYYDAVDLAAPAPRVVQPLWATMHRDERWKLSIYHGLDQGELYDLTSDPQERIDRWHDPALQPIRERLTRHAFDALAMSLDPGCERIGRY